jgi:hypothetical protein
VDKSFLEAREVLGQGARAYYFAYGGGVSTPGMVSVVSREDIEDETKTDSDLLRYLTLRRDGKAELATGSWAFTRQSY